MADSVGEEGGPNCGIENGLKTWAQVLKSTPRNSDLSAPMVTTMPSLGHEEGALEDFGSFPEIPKSVSKINGNPTSTTIESEAQIAVLQEKTTKLSGIVQNFMRMELCITAREILKRAINLKGKKIGDGYHFFKQIDEVKIRALVSWVFSVSILLVFLYVMSVSI